jgi:aspartyl protease family protein
MLGWNSINPIYLYLCNILYLIIGGKMGIQDRDYYREKHKEASKDDNSKNFRKNGSNPPPFTGRTHHCLSRKSEKTKLKYLLYPVFALVLLWYGANALLDKIKSGKAILPELVIKMLPSASQMPINLIPGGIILQTDHSGHFKGTVLINNIPMLFMIDTDATQTVIPANLAIAARLPFGKSVQVNTAGGKVFDQLTQISSLKIGNAEIRNLDASINQHVDEVLIGMNTLKYFHMSQNENRLTLVAYTKPEEIAKIERGLMVVRETQTDEKTNYRIPVKTLAPDQSNNKGKTTWRKMVACDGQKNCKTIYGDH